MTTHCRAGETPAQGGKPTTLASVAFLAPAIYNRKMRPIKLITESVETAARSQMVNVTERVQRLVAQHKIVDGLAVVFVPHTTAGISLQENADPDTQHDLLRKLEHLVPAMEDFYEHDEGNSDSHVKTAMVGNTITLVIENGRLVLGRWQAIFLCEFDGPRERRINVKLFIADAAPGKSD
jgi:secondary thiamine-phosphate synthase enzyme